MAENSKSDNLAIVQFIHPGKEQTNINIRQCPWNVLTKPHRRKFLVGQAEYDSYVGTASSGPIGFWGEWEGPSFAEKINSGGKPSYKELPEFFHFPAYYKPESSKGLRDTDPFVFGDQFLYNGCQQFTSKGRTFLRQLAVGSLILFGSSIQKQFVLDTVFIVSDYTDYQNGDFTNLEGLVPSEYYELTLKTQAAGNSHIKDSYRLYRGATKTKPHNGMFSFTPCKPLQGSQTAFSRPVIDLPSITQVLTQGKKMTRATDVEIRSAWDSICSQVISHKYSLAHHIDLQPQQVKCKPPTKHPFISLPGWDKVHNGDGYTVEEVLTKELGVYYAIRAPGNDSAYVQSMPEGKFIKLRADDVVIDIGGYIGEYAMRAARAGVKRVVSYEPTPSSYAVLNENLRSYHNASAIQAAIVCDDENKSIDLFLSEGGGTRNRIGDPHFQKRKKSVRVPAVPFTEAIEEATILKIDTEGAEWVYPIAENITDILRAIILEFHPGYYPRKADGKRVEDQTHIDHTCDIIKTIEAAGFVMVYPKNREAFWDRYHKHGLQWAVPAAWMKPDAV